MRSWCFCILVALTNTSTRAYEHVGKAANGGPPRYPTYHEVLRSVSLYDSSGGVKSKRMCWKALREEEGKGRRVLGAEC